MIDLMNEELFPLADAGKHKLLMTRGNKPASYGTVLRHAQIGIRGIKLETVSKPGGLHTSDLAIIRFIEQLSTPPGMPTPTTKKQRAKAQEQAKRVLANAGII